MIWWALIFFGVPVLTLIAYGMAGSLIRNILEGFFFYTGGAVNWGGIGTIWMIAGIGVPALIVLFCAISSSRAVRRAQNKNVQAIETFLRCLDAGQTPDSLPPEWFFLERSLISSKREAQLAGEQAKLEAQRKNDLVTYLAHDLRTPLASVLGYVSLLDEVPDLPLEQRRKYTKIALEKARRLEGLIDELFDVIRFNLQTMALRKEKIRLPFMLEQMADEFYPILLSADKRIRVEAEEGLRVEGDPDKLARVFNNILKNAAAYSDPGTEIVIRARREDKWICLEFENHGEKIPEEKLQVIFEKFYRLDSSRSSRTGGAGLGLAIARQIVEAHGGTIAVSSDASRTIFTVRLPAGEEPETA